ncbi:MULTISPECIES: hypothetical protein [unclassified Rhizobium]|uniref:hypothetical protein n=1 Tax=unclassified Rhizobium TaxID=2613769 RepID=UPI000EA9F98E|nr:MULTISPECIES: hypothetical protein [unclassified Rhizobium]AYG69875.1 hypothetical protein CCGE531_27715 [Rhizobium sp. CCGE531]AYG76255.1 hypothetical protein CCGE532_27205 [Rhizobium sp. CCGE532]
MTPLEPPKLPKDPTLRAMLINRARRFLVSEAAVNRVVERTINVACDDPEIFDGANMNDALFALLHRHVLDEIHPVMVRHSETEMSILTQVVDIQHQALC